MPSLLPQFRVLRLNSQISRESPATDLGIHVINQCRTIDAFRLPEIRPKRLRDTFCLYIMSTILLIILILLLIGALPSWPYSRGWGYYPSGGLGLILVIVIILALLGRI